MKSQTLNLLKKEMKLGNTSQTLIWMICCFGMFFIPSYPSYIGPFYITLCIMMTFALNQSSHDILYTVLLPVRKIDTVKARFLYCGLIEILSLVLALIPTLLRYCIPSFPENRAGINTTPAYFGLQLILYAIFNLIFLGNVYKNPLKPGLRYFAGAVVYLMNGLDMNKILLLVLQLLTMAAVYYLLSRVFNLLGYRIFKEKIHQYKHKLPFKKTEEQSISKE